MKAKFHAYYPPDSDALTKLWQCSLIALDANVLLNLYTYSKSTNEVLLVTF